MVILLVAIACAGCVAPSAPTPAGPPEAVAAAVAPASAPDAPATTLHAPGRTAEFFRFVLDEPPAGDVRIEGSFQRIAQDGAHAFAYVFLAPEPTFRGQVSGATAHDYLEIRSEGTTIVSCCAQAMGVDGRVVAHQRFEAGLPRVEVWILIAGWHPHDAAWFRVTFQPLEGLSTDVPLAERVPASVLNLREAYRQEGVHVVANGVTVASTRTGLDIALPAPHLGFLWTLPHEASLSVALQGQDGGHRAELLPGDYVTATLATASIPGSVSLAPSAVHGFVGMLVWCACDVGRDVAFLDGPWQPSAEPPAPAAPR